MMDATFAFLKAVAAYKLAKEAYESAGGSPSKRGTDPCIEVVESTDESVIRTLDTNGNEILAGKLTLGANGVNSMDAVTVSQLNAVVGNIEAALEALL